MKKVLVTGGAGYIGSHTVVELVEAGYTPIIIDNLSNTSKQNLTGINQIIKSKVKWYNIDCTDKKAMNKIFQQEGKFQAVIHFAAYKAVEESVKNPKKYYLNNIGSLEILLLCMKENNSKNIIFSSSCTVYGMPDILPVDENSPFKKASSPYAETKQICEKMLLNNTCNSLSLRYFNPIGSHKSALIGDCSSDKASNLVPIIAETAIGKRDKVTVFGNDYKTNDGTCIRDYIHVVDLAKAHTCALNYLLDNKGVNNEFFNIGTGKGNSVLEIINSFEKVTGKKVVYKIGQRRPGDITAAYADNEKALKYLHWKPNYSLEDALLSAWNWEKNYRKT